MKSKEFIVEAELNDMHTRIIDGIAKQYNISPENMEQIVNITQKAGMKLNVIEWLVQIAQRCQPYIKEVGWDYVFKLYRGVMSDVGEFIQKNVRLEDRKPKAMDPFLYDQINNYFTEHFGAPFRNAMLTTGDSHHTIRFGEVYVVFPRGNFKYLWGEEVDDLNFAYSDFMSSDIVDKNVEGNVWSSNNTDLISDLFMEHYIKKVKWHTTDLKKAIEEEVEIMIRCKQYYGINVRAHQKHFPAMRQIMKLALNEK